jgi:hypothetical protein
MCVLLTKKWRGNHEKTKKDTYADMTKSTKQLYKTEDENTNIAYA